MGLFKSSDERRVERDIKIRQGIRRIERAIREQGKFTEEFIRNAQRAKKIGDDQQYQFIRNSLKKTATVKRVLERQLLTVKNALLVKRQAEASSDFARSMGLMAAEIGRLFGETDLLKTQVDWERAMSQSQSMEERMGLFLDTVEDIATQDAESSAEQTPLSDEDIDVMIEAEESAVHQKELARLGGLREELASLRADAEKKKE
jgi:hypothetical protein